MKERGGGVESDGKSLDYYEQANQLKEIRDSGNLGLANYHCCQEVLKRVHKAFDAFFRGIKRKQRAGYPRFKSHRRYDSITFPSHGDGNKLLEKHLRVQGVGAIKIKLHRPVSGTIKTLAVKRAGNHWYACFSCEISPQPLPENTNQIGIDVELKSFATLSTVEIVNNPGHFATPEKRLRRTQRRMSR